MFCYDKDNRVLVQFCTGVFSRSKCGLTSDVIFFERTFNAAFDSDEINTALISWAVGTYETAVQRSP
jgi:hypothetical protein